MCHASCLGMIIYYIKGDRCIVRCRSSARELSQSLSVPSDKIGTAASCTINRRACAAVGCQFRSLTELTGIQ